MSRWNNPRCGFQKGHSYSSKGENNHRWKGGIKVHSDGYILVRARNHPFCNCQGYVMKHRLVMEKSIGRYLKPQEIVHHINDDRTDNRIENLKLFKNRNDHIRFHNLTR